jgi:hypothetical protein
VTTILNDTIPVSAQVADKLNTIQGIVYVPDLLGVSNEDILHELSSQNIVQVRRMLKGKEKNPTNLFVLTFGGLSIPERVKFGYEYVRLGLSTLTPYVVILANDLVMVLLLAETRLSAGSVPNLMLPTLVPVPANLVVRIAPSLTLATLQNAPTTRENWKLYISRSIIRQPLIMLGKYIDKITR